MSLDLDNRQRAMLQEMGVHVWLPLAAELPVAATPIAMPSAKPVMEAAPTPAAAVQAKAQVAPRLDAAGWQELVAAAASCQSCGLCAGRKNTTLQAPQVAQADWLIVGDPPDEDEDRSGKAFAEQAGVLLDNMLRAMRASRDVAPFGDAPMAGAYVTNVVKCRPPHGQNPQAADLATCATFLQREIALVQPKVILAMGRFAIQSLLAEQPELASQPLGKLRGTVHRYRGVPLVVTYHPKVLLRASADKAKVWADLCLAMDVVQA